MREGFRELNQRDMMQLASVAKRRWDTVPSLLEVMSVSLDDKPENIIFHCQLLASCINGGDPERLVEALADDNTQPLIDMFITRAAESNAIACAMISAMHEAARVRGGGFTELLSLDEAAMETLVALQRAANAKRQIGLQLPMYGLLCTLSATSADFRAAFIAASGMEHLLAGVNAVVYNTVVAANACGAVGCYAESEEDAGAVLVSGGVPALVNALSRSSELGADLGGALQQACYAIAAFASLPTSSPESVKTAFAVELAKEGVSTPLLAVLAASWPDPGVVAAVAEILTWLSAYGLPETAGLTADAHVSACVAVLSRHKFVANVVAAAAGLVTSIALEPGGVDALSRCSSTAPSLLKALQMHITHPAAAAALTEALLSLSDVTAAQPRPAIVRLIGTLLDALKSVLPPGALPPSVTVAAGFAASTTASASAAAASAAGGEFAEGSPHPLAQTQRWALACVGLLRVLCVDAANHSALLAARAPLVLAASLSEFAATHNGDIAEDAAATLWLLTESAASAAPSSAATGDTTFEVGACVPGVLKALAAQSDNTAVLEYCCGALRDMAAFPGGRAACAHLGCAVALIEVLRFAGDASYGLIEHACWALGALSLEAGQVDTCVGEGAVGVLIAIAQRMGSGSSSSSSSSSNSSVVGDPSAANAPQQQRRAAEGVVYALACLSLPERHRGTLKLGGINELLPMLRDARALGLHDDPALQSLEKRFPLEFV